MSLAKILIVWLTLCHRKRWTALACEHNWQENMLYDWHIVTEDGRTALDIAAQERRAEIAIPLIDKGADVSRAAGNWMASGLREWSCSSLYLIGNVQTVLDLIRGDHESACVSEPDQVDQYWTPSCSLSLLLLYPSASVIICIRIYLLWWITLFCPTEYDSDVKQWLKGQGHSSCESGTCISWKIPGVWSGAAKVKSRKSRAPRGDITFMLHCLSVRMSIPCSRMPFVDLPWLIPFYATIAWRYTPTNMIHIVDRTKVHNFMPGSHLQIPARSLLKWGIKRKSLTCRVVTRRAIDIIRATYIHIYIYTYIHIYIYNRRCVKWKVDI
jgi:hypothetical protein